MKGRIRQRILGALAGLVALAAIVTHAPMLGLLGTQPIREFPAFRKEARAHPPLAAVFLSGDMGFHFGMSGDVAQALADHGIPVIGVTSPAVFAHQRSYPEAQAIVEGAIRLALARTGAQRVLLMGQSYGADIVATVAPELPPDLRAKVAAIDLTVPALDVYFRADPSGLAYLGKADAHPLAGVRAIDWAPVICVHGLGEPGSLCPALRGTHVAVIGLPGDHHLNHDHVRVVATTLAALRAAVPGEIA